MDQFYNYLNNKEIFAEACNPNHIADIPQSESPALPGVIHLYSGGVSPIIINLTIEESLTFTENATKYLWANAELMYQLYALISSNLDVTNFDTDYPVANTWYAVVPKELAEFYATLLSALGSNISVLFNGQSCQLEVSKTLRYYIDQILESMGGTAGTPVDIWEQEVPNGQWDELSAVLINDVPIIFSITFALRLTTNLVTCTFTYNGNVTTKELSPFYTISLQCNDFDNLYVYDSDYNNYYDQKPGSETDFIVMDEEYEGDSEPEMTTCATCGGTGVELTITSETCLACSGSGYISGTDPESGDEISETCNMCGGSGFIDSSSTQSCGVCGGTGEVPM